MAEKLTTDHIGGSGSDHSPSLSKDDPLGVLLKLPDPDEGLSEEERLKLVSVIV